MRTAAWRCALWVLGSASVLYGLAADAQAQPQAQAQAGSAKSAVTAVTAVQAQLRQGLALEALATADAALVRQPGEAALRFLRGVALMDLQRNPQAEQVFSALAQEYPELPDPWNNLALLHVRAGEPERARQALEVALRNDPSHRTARLNLGEVYLMLAAQSWQQAAQSAALEPAQAQRLQTVRQLLSTRAVAR